MNLGIKARETMSIGDTISRRLYAYLHSFLSHTKLDVTVFEPCHARGIWAFPGFVGFPHAAIPATANRLNPFSRISEEFEKTEYGVNNYLKIIESFESSPYIESKLHTSGPTCIAGDEHSCPDSETHQNAPVSGLEWMQSIHHYMPIGSHSRA